MKSKIYKLMLLLKQQKDEKLQMNIDKLHNLNVTLNLFLKNSQLSETQK